MTQVIGATKYRADITAGALKLAESRVVAGLLLDGLDADGWRDAVVTRNVLQARSAATATRLAKLIRGRLETMGANLWRLVKDGSGTVAAHAALAAAVKHSPLLGDFLDLVVREQHRLFAEKLSNGLWESYLDGCRERDTDMPLWADSTRRRLRSSVFQTLAQAGYIDGTRTLRLRTVHVAEPVRRYLRANGERYVLRCLEVNP